MIIVELIAGGLPHVMDANVDRANYVFCTFFLAEWLLGLALSRRRTAYLVNLWLLIDLISAIPLSSVLQALRLARFGRLLRFVKLLKLLRGRRFAFPVARVARSIGVSVSIASAGAFALRAAEPEAVSSFADAMWWSIVTLTTVGYGDITPATHWGRLIAVVLMTTGVGVFSYLAGLMASTVFDPEEDHILKTVVSIDQRLDALVARLDQQESDRTPD